VKEKYDFIPVLDEVSVASERNIWLPFISLTWVDAFSHSVLICRSWRLLYAGDFITGI